MKRLTRFLTITLILLVMVSFVSAQMPITLPFYIRIADLVDVLRTAPTDNYIFVYDSATGLWGPEAITGAGGVDISGTPVDNDFAKFTDGDTVEGRSYSETLSDLSGEATASVVFDWNGAHLGNVQRIRGCDDHNLNIYANNLTTAAAEKDMIFWTLDATGNAFIEVFRINANSTTPSFDLTKTFNSGVDGTGYDITLYSATANDYWLWDESADAVVHHMTMGETTAGETGHTITVVDATTASAGMHRGLVVDTTLSGNKTGTAYNAGINVDLSTTGNTPQAYGVASYMTQTGNPTIGNAVGLESYMEDMGTAVANLIGVDIGINSTNTASSRHTGMRIRNHSGTATTAIQIESAFATILNLAGATASIADIALQNGETIKNDSDGTIEYSGFMGVDLTSQTISANFNVNWTTGNFQKVDVTGLLTATFTAPGTTGKCTLLIVQGDGDDTITWPGTILWPGGVAPTLSTGNAEVDIIVFYWDGTNYFGLFNGDFQ